jgi:hypothetical protein
VSILSPIIFATLLLGAMIPYWFSAMTMKSVGMAANEMVKEVIAISNPAQTAASFICMRCGTAAVLRRLGRTEGPPGAERSCAIKCRDGHDYSACAQPSENGHAERPGQRMHVV